MPGVRLEPSLTPVFLVAITQGTLSAVVPAQAPIVLRTLAEAGLRVAVLPAPDPPPAGHTILAADPLRPALVPVHLPARRRLPPSLPQATAAAHIEARHRTNHTEQYRCFQRSPTPRVAGRSARLRRNLYS